VASSELKIIKEVDLSEIRCTLLLNILLNHVDSCSTTRLSTAFAGAQTFPTELLHDPSLEVITRHNVVLEFVPFRFLDFCVAM